MLTRLATVTFVAVMSLSPPIEQNPADELAALKREIQALKEQQAQIQKELQAIKTFLQAAMQPRQAQEPEVPGLIGAMIPTEGEPSMGPAGAKLTILEISDYHCPFCKRHTQQTFPQIVNEFVNTGKARYVFVHYPIAQLHPQAARSHEAAACAGEQGKFWEMHASLFATPPAKEDGALTAQAKAVGVDPAKFTACLTSGRQRRAHPGQRQPHRGARRRRDTDDRDRPHSGARAADESPQIRLRRAALRGLQERRIDAVSGRQ